MSSSLDQFFTRPQIVSRIVNKIILPLIEEHRIDTFLDSSASDGMLGRRIGSLRVINYDIDPKHDDVTQADFLEVKPHSTTRHRFMIGFNPPFGKNGKTANRFLDAASRWNPVVMIMILPHCSTKHIVPGYTIRNKYAMPNDAFYTADGRTFRTPSFMCIYTKGDNNIAQ